VKKETRTSRASREKLEYVKFLNTKPTEEAFSNYVTGSMLRPYHIYYLSKYPNGGIPLFKIKYRNGKRS
jgi:hypothetical protein